MKRNILMLLALVSVTSSAVFSMDSAASAVDTGVSAEPSVSKPVSRRASHVDLSATKLATEDAADEAAGEVAKEPGLWTRYTNSIKGQGTRVKNWFTAADQAAADGTPWYKGQNMTRARRGTDATGMAVGLGAIAATNTMTVDYLTQKVPAFGKLPRALKRAIVAVVEGLLLEVTMSLIGGRYETNYSLIGGARQGASYVADKFSAKKTA